VQNTGWGAYLFFAVFSVLSGIWAALFVRETNGRTLEEMDAVFGDAAHAVDEQRHAIIEALKEENGREAAGVEKEEEKVVQKVNEGVSGGAFPQTERNE
jgi:hypothetical protein